jgi:hypothetical protein
MIFEKRILKSGLLAVIVTLAFAVFAYRVADWSKGMRSQMAGGHNAVSPSCAAESMQTKVIPQMAMGLFNGGLTYTTIIQIVNTSSMSQTVSGTFYKQDGNPLTDVVLNSGESKINNGILETTSIPQDGILVVTGGGPKTTATVGWGRINACAGLSITTFFELRDSQTNALYSRVGVDASPANMSRFVIPRVREASAGLDVGIALVNTGSVGTKAILHAELRNSAGELIKATDIEMPGGSQRTGFTKDLFAPLDEAAGRTYQYVKFSSTSPSFAAIALAFEGGTQTSFPVHVIE